MTTTPQHAPPDLERRLAQQWETIAANGSNLIHVETSDTHEPVCSLPRKHSALAERIASDHNTHAALVEALEEAVDAAGHSDYCVKVNLELSDVLSELPAEDRTPGDTAWRCACRRAKWDAALAAAKGTK